jgi:hypothetical protein
MCTDREDCDCDCTLKGCDMPPCVHPESDQFGPICLWCFHVEWPNPAWYVVVVAIVYFGIRLALWAKTGFMFTI